MIQKLFLFLVALHWAHHPALAGAPTTADGFALPLPDAHFAFPRDHGSHPDYKIEWWYVTGHLFATNTGVEPKRFGFQATFFRRATPRTQASTAATPNFGDQHLFLAHLALLDVSTGKFLHQERLNREGWDAQSDTHTLAVRNGDWSLRIIDPITTQMELQGTINTAAKFQLRLVPTKPLVIFGTRGVSQKAAEIWASSHYLTFPRLATTGTVQLGPQSFSVTGEAWMDHEISSSQLGAGQAGWDWACLQLDDGREIMTYRMRRTDGTTDPFSTLAWVDSVGSVRQCGPDGFRLEALSRWRSPRSKANYPSRVRLVTADPQNGRERAFILEPLATDQELSGALGGMPYWEGACRVLNEEGKTIGQAFLEMTGYAGSWRGTLE